MKENWYALFLCIIKSITPDKAMKSLLCIGHRNNVPKPFNVPLQKKERKPNLNYIDDPITLIKLKETHTYSELAKLYKTYPHKIYNDIKNYKQQLNGI